MVISISINIQSEGLGVYNRYAGNNLKGMANIGMAKNYPCDVKCKYVRCSVKRSRRNRSAQLIQILKEIMCNQFLIKTRGVRTSAIIKLYNINVQFSYQVVGPSIMIVNDTGIQCHDEMM